MLFSSEELNFNDKKWFLRKIKHIVSQGNLKINYDSKYDEIKSCMSDEEKNIHKSLMFESMINSINRGNIK